MNTILFPVVPGHKNVKTFPTYLLHISLAVRYNKCCWFWFRIRGTSLSIYSNQDSPLICYRIVYLLAYKRMHCFSNIQEFTL